MRIETVDAGLSGTGHLQPHSEPFEDMARAVMIGLHELSGRLHGDMLLGTATNQTLALLERARLLLRTACADDVREAEAESYSSCIAQGGLAGWQMRAVTLHIDTQLEEKLSLECLAAIARLSPSYLCRAFRRSFGCSPMQYVTQRRLEAAKALLQKGTLPLREIALQCGFADQPHFTRLFRAATGDTPRRWRQIWQHRNSVAIGLSIERGSGVSPPSASQSIP